MISGLKQTFRWLKHKSNSIYPGKNAVLGAAMGVLISCSLIWILYALNSATSIHDNWMLIFFFAYTLASILFGFLAYWLLTMFIKIPRVYLISVLISLSLLITMSFHYSLSISLVIMASLVGAAILVLKKGRFPALSIEKKVVIIFGLIIGLGGFIATATAYLLSGFKTESIVNAANLADSEIKPLSIPSPKERGPYNVKVATYGSGNDLHRPEYSQNATFITESVNGLAFLDNWEGLSGWWRERYWGFDSRSLPLNGRIWYPLGKGPFPLTLIVHGNHDMQDYSDEGYEYIGKLLASRGIITVSVDQNFINASWSDIFGGLDDENDARAWLLLEHLRVFHEWNETENHPFFHRIDTANIALIGHSRGGEAVAHAAVFNKLSHYPDDASFKFNYNFNIKSIAAIAPVDGQYKLGSTKTAVDNINYLVIHGSQDGDVSSFMGSQQYERINFTDSLYFFKSGVYIYGANHGQFNSKWGKNDSSNPFDGLLNLKQLISADYQRTIAEVYLSSFLEITLKNNRQYLPLFIDWRKGREWLPNTIYLNQFQDSSFKAIADFNEDFEVTSISEPEGRLSSQNLTIWREEEIRLKWHKKGSRAVTLGWNYEFRNEEEHIEDLPDSIIARYEVQFPKRVIDSTTALVFSMAESNENANPKSGGKWLSTNNENFENSRQGGSTYNKKDWSGQDSNSSENQQERNSDTDEPLEPLNFTIQLKDAIGNELFFPLSHFSPLQREIERVLTKIDFVFGEVQSEQVFQTFHFPISDIKAYNPDFDFTQIENVSFIFDMSESGVVTIDDIGTMNAITVY